MVLVMLDDPNFLPVLQQATWSRAAECMVRPVVPPGDNSRDRSPLIVSYAVVSPGQVNSLTSEKAQQQGWPLAEVDRAARDHLRAYPDRGAWEVTKVDGHRFYQRRGGAVTSSLLLSTTSMRKVHEGVGRATAFVAVPDRSTLIVASEPGLLGPVAERMWRSAAHDARVPLSRHVFELRGGKVVGYVPHAEDEDEPPRAEPGEAERPDEEVRRVVAVPCLAFLLVAGVEGNIHEEQIHLFLSTAERFAGDGSLSPATRDVFARLHTHAQTLLAELHAPQGNREGEVVTRIALALRAAGRAWGEAVASEIGGATYEMVGRVAETSGGGLLPFGSTIGRRERAALEALRPVLMMRVAV